MSYTSVDGWYDHITYEAETWAYKYKNDEYKEGNGHRTVYLTAQDCAEIAEMMGPFIPCGPSTPCVPCGPCTPLVPLVPVVPDVPLSPCGP